MTTSSSTRVKPSRSVFTSEPGQGRPVSDILGLIIKPDSLLDRNDFVEIHRNYLFKKPMPKDKAITM
jgi:hypothetical protein